ncbi:uncharacterized protein LOC115629042 [Scaptodrosophila lebanonensis]|uniref:Uncharacterized protein LOC115629042 n=1 Tax=Drosophila lebanonensis TaxID=7225 RepID=A0A6J2TZW9_DROLE|nr:uncharacterized protein LOC115629042 [Scaptodrosophila lebanonensis]
MASITSVLQQKLPELAANGARTQLHCLRCQCAMKLRKSDNSIQPYWFSKLSFLQSHINLGDAKPYACKLENNNSWIPGREGHEELNLFSRLSLLKYHEQAQDPFDA